jgi:hypothetical protein
MSREKYFSLKDVSSWADLLMAQTTTRFISGVSYFISLSSGGGIEKSRRSYSPPYQCHECGAFFGSSYFALAPKM